MNDFYIVFRVYYNFQWVLIVESSSQESYIIVINNNC